MNRLDNIKQASTPIYQFKGVGEKANEYVSGKEAIYSQNTKRMYPDGFPVSNMRLSKKNDFGHGFNDMVHILNKFNYANEDNPYTLNPLNPDGTYDDIKFIPRAYDINLALSNWNDIKLKYGDSIDKIATKVQESASFDCAYEGAALTLGSAAYLSECAGLNSKDINLIFNNAEYKDGYINANKLEDMRTILSSDVDNSEDIIENTSTKALSVIAKNIDNPSLDKEVLDTVFMSKDKNISACLLKDLSSEFILDNNEVKDIASAFNLMHEHLTKHDVNTSVLPDIYKDVRAIIQKERNNFYSENNTNEYVSVLGDNKLTNLMSSYIDNMNDTIDFSQSLYHFKDKPMSEYKDIKKKFELEYIQIPLGLVDGPRDGKYGKYDIISVPFEDKFGKMTVSDSLVTKNDKIAILTLASDKNKVVQFYDKDTKTSTNKEYSVS